MSSLARAHSQARRPRRRRSPLPALLSLSALAVAGWVILERPHGVALLAPALEQAGTDAAKPASPSRPDLAWMFEPSPVLRGANAPAFAPGVPVLALNATTPEAAPMLAPVPAPVLAAAPTAPPAPPAPPATLAAATPRVRVASVDPTLVPLPVSRPANLLPAAPVPPAIAPRLAARQTRTRDVFRAAIKEEPSFFDRLFGGGAAPAAPPQQALAYANPDAVATPRPSLGPAPTVDAAGGTAVYDISAGTVTLPNGEVLEAHSGYGELMDDPRYVHVRMRGATPPGTYDMREREAAFHGVRAIRLTPVGGSAAIHGRDGILAHTYMLRRQPGASNGCVVFRDYDRFLRAYLRGEVRRLVVVAGNRGGRLDVASRSRGGW